jgi:hypothetical protein
MVKTLVIIVPRADVRVEIVIAEQIEPTNIFNRGKIMNAGIKIYAQKYGAPDHVRLDQ